jgi:hypothetical protein
MIGDPYEISGSPRRIVKVAFNILINADTHAAAIKPEAQPACPSWGLLRADAYAGMQLVYLDASRRLSLIIP